jgi:cytochrome c-type biogenesis protein CcmH
MRTARFFLVMCAVLMSVSLAHAVQPDEMLKDPVLEARARTVSTGLRCLVCQNQSIDESEASVARDLRLLIRDQISQGRTDGEVVDFVVARYGDYVLLKPRFAPSTYILWSTPFGLVFVGIALAWRRMRRAGHENVSLTEAERAELEALLRK